MKSRLLHILCALSLSLSLFIIGMWVWCEADWDWHVTHWQMPSGSRWEVGFAFDHFSVIRADPKPPGQASPVNDEWWIGDRLSGFLIERSFLVDRADQIDDIQARHWQWRVDLPCWLLVILTLQSPLARWLWPPLRRRCSRPLHAARRWWPVGLV